MKDKTPCLESCLKQLESLLENLSNQPSDFEASVKSQREGGAKPSPPPFPLAGAAMPAATPISMGPAHMASFDNANIPYPRYSGARFSRDGTTLVCFGRRTHQRTWKNEYKAAVRCT